MNRAFGAPFPAISREDTRRLENILQGHPALYRVIAELPACGLADAWVGAGCVIQTVWNHLYGYVPGRGVKDVDIVYFDPRNLSQEGEESAEAALAARFPHCPFPIDATNEARVHLWYHEKFGKAIPPYRSTADAIASWPTTASAVGVRGGPGELEICAPFGLEDLLAGIVRPNKRLVSREVYEAKANRWKALWPELRAVDW